MTTSAASVRVSPRSGVDASWRIGKQATRWLNGRTDGHPFSAEAVLCTPELVRVGFTIDFGRHVALKRHIDDRFDHSSLNEGVSGVSDVGLAAYLSSWARPHQPGDGADALVGVRIRKVLDGSVLIESLDLNPTSEHLARYLCDWMGRGPTTDRASETESGWAQYTRGGM